MDYPFGDPEEREGNDLHLSPFEMEEECTSLIQETADISSVWKHMKLRRRPQVVYLSSKNHVLGDQDDDSTHIISKTTYFYIRNACWLALIACFVGLFVTGMDTRVEQAEENVAKQQTRRGPHQTSFGGTQNTIHHPINDDNDDDDAWILDDTGMAVLSLSKPNLENENGHYWHDALLSPFSSTLYEFADESTKQGVLQERQIAFERRMNETKQRWGAWDLPPEDQERPEPVYDDNDDHHRDISLDDIPDGAWQKDRDYVDQFLRQAQLLARRVQQAIYEEYGHSRLPDGTDLTLEQVRDRSDMFGVITEHFSIGEDGAAMDLTGTTRKQGIAYLNPNAWDGLIRKLIHAMMTSGYFYVVLVGDASTYHGNNFWQTQIMQFNYILEPVLDFLGIKLITRHMGMEVSSTVSALGGGDIYGEADIVWHIAPSETTGQHDLLNKQFILSGERVPIILTSDAANLMQESNGKAWLGNIQPGADVCPVTKTGVLARDVDPPACRNVRCKGEGTFCGEYNSVCWVDRINWHPDHSQDQNVGFQRNGYPGWRQHQWEGRKLSLLLLQGIEAAVDKWVTAMDDDGFPLKETHWHVGSIYDSIRESVRLSRAAKGKARKLSQCELMMSIVDRRICHVAMHAYTDWTPRVVPTYSSLKTVSSSLEQTNANEIYRGVDLLPWEWHVPDGEVDVHMVAIATSTPVETDGFSYDDFDDDFPFDDDDFLREDGGRQLAASRAYHPVRKLAGKSTVIQPGQGWTLVNEPVGFCDGSSQSRCNRREGNPCLLANYNHYQPYLLGKPENGWLVINLENVEEGIILVRLSVQVVKNGLVHPQGALPKDLRFEYAIDGAVTSLSDADFVSFGKDIASDVTVYPLMVRKNPPSQQVEVALRVQSTANPDVGILLTHLYYA